MMGKTQELHTKGYLKPTKLKSISDEEGSGIIIRSDKELIYVIHAKDKTYSEMTFKEFEGHIAKMNEQMKQMQEQLKNVPPEQREMMEKMMGGMMAEKEYQLKKTGEKKKIAGHTCEKILLYEGDKEAGELWMTKDIGSMKDYAKDWSKLMDKLVQGPMAKVYRKLAELDGFMMQFTMGGTASTTTKLEKRSISNSEFEIPEGYKKVEMEKMEEK